MSTLEQRQLSISPGLFRSNAVLLAPALFAFAWSLLGTHVQSITIAEANTYRVFIVPGCQWNAGNNIHVLITLLMRFFTLAFGTHLLAMRAPALIGAGIYIAVCYRLCRLLAASAALRWAIFVCLVYN